MAGEAEVVAPTEEESAKAFAEGFDTETPPAQAATPPAEAPAAGVTQPVTQEPKPGAAAEPSPVQEPEYVQLTKGELADLKAAAAETASIKQQMSKAFGTMGNMQQLINQIRSQSPAGAPVEITDDDFAELKEDFPELAGHTLAGLQRILKKVNLTGTGQPATQTIDPEQVRVAAANVVHAEGMRDLDDLHPGWRDIVGKPDDAENPYRKWLATQTPEYQELIRSTYSASITARSIDRFKAAEAAKAKPAAASPKPPAATGAVPHLATRRDRIEAAVQPRGNGATPPAPRPLTPEEHFAAGFNS